MIFVLVVYFERFSDRIFVTEKALGHTLRQYQGERVLKSCPRISCNRRKRKNIEQRGVRPGEIPDGKHFLSSWIIIRPVFHKIVMPKLEANDLFCLDDIFRDPFAHGRSRGKLTSVFALDSIDSVRIFMMFVNAQFMLDKEHDQHETGHADGQTQNIDKGIAFVLKNVS